MNGQEIRDRLLHSYERSYDIVKPSEVNGHTYDACASYHESGAKYVLSKKAELWRISCHEHAYFKAVSGTSFPSRTTFGSIHSVRSVRNVSTSWSFSSSTALKYACS